MQLLKGHNYPKLLKFSVQVQLFVKLTVTFL